jgi:fucose 4-O-acetylase-like acetyltransferase
MATNRHPVSGDASPIAPRRLPTGRGRPILLPRGGNRLTQRGITRGFACRPFVARCALFRCAGDMLSHLGPAFYTLQNPGTAKSNQTARCQPASTMNAPPQSRNHRSPVVDIAKGIAIILVVYGHCLRGLIAANIIPANSALIPTDYVVYTFHMPLFFLLSGLFFRQSLQKNETAFWIGKLRLIVYPYFLWSLVQGCIQIILAQSGAVNNPLKPDRLIHILWEPISPFWFLYALFFCNVISRAVIRFRAEAVLLAALVMFLLTFHFHAGTLQDIAYGFLYFTLGILANSRGWLNRIPASWTSAGLITAGFVAVAYGSLALGVPERLPFAAALLGIVATLAICNAMAASAASDAVARALASVGRYSMSIYVMHILVLGFIRAILLHKLHVTNFAVLLPTAVLAAVSIPMLVQRLGDSVRVSKYIGLPSLTKIEYVK